MKIRLSPQSPIYIPIMDMVYGNDYTTSPYYGHMDGLHSNGWSGSASSRASYTESKYAELFGPGYTVRPDMPESALVPVFKRRVR